MVSSRACSSGPRSFIGNLLGLPERLESHAFAAKTVVISDHLMELRLTESPHGAFP